MVKKIIIRFSLCFMLLVMSVSIVHGQFPPLPHAFYGRVYINGEPAPVGVQIEGRGENVKVNIQGNPIITVEKGFYGSADSSTVNLIIQGNIREGTLIEFYVDGQKAFCGQNGEWEEAYPYTAGGITSLDLWVGRLTTEKPLPTITKTPTFVPTTPITSTPTKMGQIIASTPVPQGSTMEFTPTSSPTLTITNSKSTSTPVVVEGESIDESDGSVVASTKEHMMTQNNNVSENPSVTQNDTSRVNPLILIVVAAVLIGALVIVWMVIKKKQTANDQEDLL